MSPEEQKKEPLCISVPAAGRLLGVSRGTAYSMVRLRQLPTIRCGARRLVVPLPALHRMLEGKDDDSHP
jgi:predicted DNA-binding transcriptional regulator AlpA